MTVRAEDAVERRAEGIARRVRGLMGEQRVTGQRLALVLSMSGPAVSRRTTGELEFSVSDLEVLADLFGVSEAYLYGFTNDRTPDREAGGSGVRHVGLEPTTRWLTLCPPVEADDEPLADVVPFPVHLASVPVSA